MLRFHARALVHVCLVSFHLREMHVFLAVGWAVVSIVIYIIPTQKTVQQVHVLFCGIRVCLLCVGCISAITSFSPSIFTSSVIVGASPLASSIVVRIILFPSPCLLLRHVVRRRHVDCSWGWWGSWHHSVCCVGSIISRLWRLFVTTHLEGREAAF